MALDVLGSDLTALPAALSRWISLGSYGRQKTSNIHRRWKMSKTRWIMPIQSTGRIEISVNVAGQCKIQLFDSKNDKLGDTGTIDEEELAEFIKLLQFAYESLVVDPIETSSTWCCDPGSESRPVEGCRCLCCAQARALKETQPESTDEDSSEG